MRMSCRKCVANQSVYTPNKAYQIIQRSIKRTRSYRQPTRLVHYLKMLLLRNDLFLATQKLSNLNLFQALKWCAEALNGLPESTQTYTPIQLSANEVADQDKFILAKAYLNCKEFERAANVLKDCKSGDAIFLRLYLMLISIDKKATEETDGSLMTEDVDKDTVSTLNSRLSKILKEVDQYHSKNEENAFLYYLNGVIYNRKKKYTLAQSSLYKSLVIFPYNWSCWQELIASLTVFEDAVNFISRIKVTKLDLSNNVMFQIFEVVVLQEFYQQSTGLDHQLQTLSLTFPGFNFLKIQKFLMCYHNLDYFQAETIFDSVLVSDPLRLDDLDTYSNMLYVMEKKSKLSFLAQFALQIDKFRPETCCIIANYHSMKCEHEKAIMYYKRALILDKNCLSAWTLMGHEFVELKNSHAAIESYRRAVDINPKDFRAWYGLGQAYEVLDMHLYALYYYQRATNLQPLDKRMWQAIGNCYEKIDKLEEAIKSFEKALSIDESKSEDRINAEPHICYKLAILSEKLSRAKDTHKYMKLCYDQEFEWGISDSTSKARLWLARHSLERKKYDEAYELAKDLNYSNAHDIEEARSIAREARNRMLRLL